MALNGGNLPHQTQVVVVVVPLPAQGHMSQLMHLSHLISQHNIPVHFVSTVTHIRQATLRHHKSISTIHFHAFEVSPFVSPPPNPNNPETDFPSHLIPSFEASLHLREPVGKLLQSLSLQVKRVIVIHDSLMGAVVQDAKNMPNVENYTFQSTSAFANFVYFWEGMGKPPLKGFRVPKFPSVEESFPAEFIEIISENYKFNKFNYGHIYNTSRAIEGPYIELLENIKGTKKVWALGPFNPLAVEKKDSIGFRHSCMEWLDKQEPSSVIYISFGTTTALRDEQIQQIAIGLEQSKQKFIWVLRDADKGDIFDGSEAKRYELPKGFEERVEGMGLVVRDWAPQLEILSHSSTGGFLSHCGWNSCLESITMGVPMATWAMHSDQPRNAVLVTEILKVGLVVKDWAQRKSIVSASAVENGVRRLMETKEGDEMRERSVRLKKAIHRPSDEGGISPKEMDSFIAHITNSLLLSSL